MHCSNCGSYIAPGVRFCSGCGQPANDPEITRIARVPTGLPLEPVGGDDVERIKIVEPVEAGHIDLGAERKVVAGAVARLQIEARAGGEVRRLSGGNQQKVTIARWVAGGVHTMLCFDPTRGIDIGTKSQIYVLLRELAAAGAAILLYTSELKEVQLACDRAVVIFGGRVVAEIDGADADEPTLLRAAYNLRADAALPEAVAAEAVAEEAAAAEPAAANLAEPTEDLPVEGNR